MELHLANEVDPRPEITLKISCQSIESNEEEKAPRRSVSPRPTAQPPLKSSSSHFLKSVTSKRDRPRPGLYSRSENAPPRPPPPLHCCTRLVARSAIETTTVFFLQMLFASKSHLNLRSPARPTRSAFHTSDKNPTISVLDAPGHAEWLKNAQVAFNNGEQNSQR